jgi:hypothetical protein
MLYTLHLYAPISTKSKPFSNMRISVHYVHPGCHYASEALSEPWGPSISSFSILVVPTHSSWVPPPSSYVNTYICRSGHHKAMLTPSKEGFRCTYIYRFPACLNRMLNRTSSLGVYALRSLVGGISVDVLLCTCEVHIVQYIPQCLGNLSKKQSPLS